MFLIILALAGLLGPLPSTTAQDQQQALLRPGHVVFMRLSDAPGSGGYGDPPGFRLEDCATQRNLSEDGRAHARRTGEAFNKLGVVRPRAGQPLVPVTGVSLAPGEMLILKPSRDREPIVVGRLKID